MKRRELNVGVIQHACGTDRLANLETSIAGINEAADRGAELIILPELHTSRYFCQTEDPACFDLAEGLPGPTSDALATVAAARGLVIVASIFERRAAGLYHNTAVVLDGAHGIRGYYRKMHIPDDPGYHEKFYFTPGDLGFVPIDTRVGRLGVLVCWDQWYPEAARLMALAGAELLLYPTAIGWDPREEAAEADRQREAWITVQRGHAIANSVPVVACNRIGHEPDPAGVSEGIRFWGSSFVAGPQGEVIDIAPTDSAAVLVARLDLARGEALRRIWPYLRDRRIDHYQGLLQRYVD